MTKLQKQLMEPITKKLEDAINAVGATGGYTYIFDLSSVNVPYVGPASTDVTNMVKAKLGIK
jgi:outer membrane protein